MGAVYMIKFWNNGKYRNKNLSANMQLDKNMVYL